MSKFSGLRFDYPVTRLLVGGVYAAYNYTKRLDANRIDKLNTVGGNLNYRFSRKWKGLFDLKFRQKSSTFDPQNYNEISVYVSLVYGFGEARRPTRIGGY